MSAGRKVRWLERQEEKKRKTRQDKKALFYCFPNEDKKRKVEALEKM